MKRPWWSSDLVLLALAIFFGLALGWETWRLALVLARLAGAP